MGREQYIERDLVSDVVEAAIRRTVNGQIRQVEQAVLTLRHQQEQLTEDVTRLTQTLDERAERWDDAAETTARIRGFVRIAASRGGKVLAVVIAGLIGMDAVARLFFT